MIGHPATQMDEQVNPKDQGMAMLEMVNGNSGGSPAPRLSN
jgi:hypothetical protein